MIESSLDYFLQKEQKIIDDLLSQHFGYYLLHFNKFNCVDTSASKISNQIFYSNDIKFGTNILGDSSLTPFKSDSIDFVLMPHLLDYLDKKDKQTAILSEVNRILRPDGSFLITGFNKLRVKSNQLSNQLSDAAGYNFNKNNILRPELTGLANRVEQIKKLDFRVVKAISFSLSLPLPSTIKNNNKSKSSWGYDFLTQSKGISSYFCLGYVLLVKKKVLEVLPLKPKWSRVSRAAKSLINKKGRSAQNNVKRENNGE